MRSVASEVGERLGHESGQELVLLGDGLDHPPEEDVPIGRRERVRIAPVDLELAVGVFMVVGVGVPPQLLDVLDQGCHQLQVPVERPQVIARLAQGVQRVPRRVFPALVASQEHELRLDSHIHHVPLLPRPLQLLPEDVPRAIRPLLAVDKDIARDPGRVLPPGEDGQRVEVRDAGDVGVVGALADLAGSEAGEAATVPGHVLQVGRGDELGLRSAAHLHEGAEEELDPFLPGQVLYFLYVHRWVLSTLFRVLWSPTTLTRMNKADQTMMVPNTSALSDLATGRTPFAPRSIQLTETRPRTSPRPVMRSSQTYAGEAGQGAGT